MTSMCPVFLNNIYDCQLSKIRVYLFPNLAAYLSQWYNRDGGQVRYYEISNYCLVMKFFIWCSSIFNNLMSILKKLIVVVAVRICLLMSLKVWWYWWTIVINIIVSRRDHNAPIEPIKLWIDSMLTRALWGEIIFGEAFLFITALHAFKAFYEVKIWVSFNFIPVVKWRYHYQILMASSGIHILYM